MSKPRVVHFFENTIFTAPFIDLATNKIDVPVEQNFVVIGGRSLATFPAIENARVLYSQSSPFYFFKMLYWLARADVAVFHGLFNWRVLILWLTRFFHCKTLWMIWGGDLQIKPTSLKSRVVNWFRSGAAKRLHGIAVLEESDRKKFNSIFGREDIKIYPALYPNPISLERVDHARANHPTPDVKVKRVLIGNSSTESNQHDFVFRALAPLTGPGVEFVVPLGYGDSSYRERILKLGHELLGSSFRPLEGELAIENYIDILATIDVAIIYTPRQQALSNIYGLIALGSKLYLHPASGMLESFREKFGVELWSFDDFLAGERSLANLTESDSMKTKENSIRIRKPMDQTFTENIWRSNLENLSKLV